MPDSMPDMSTTPGLSCSHRESQQQAAEGQQVIDYGRTQLVVAVQGLVRNIVQSYGELRRVSADTDRLMDNDTEVYTDTNIERALHTHSHTN